MSGFGAATDELFGTVLTSLFDATCTITRDGARTGNGRFGGTYATTTVASGLACSVQHEAAGSRSSRAYADRLNGRAFATVFIDRTATVVLANDRIAVSGGGTYTVIGQPYYDGPDDPVLTIPCAAETPAATN